MVSSFLGVMLKERDRFVNFFVRPKKWTKVPSGRDPALLEILLMREKAVEIPDCVPSAGRETIPSIISELLFKFSGRVSFSEGKYGARWNANRTLLSISNAYARRI